MKYRFKPGLAESYGFTQREILSTPVVDNATHIVLQDSKGACYRILRDDIEPADSDCNIESVLWDTWEMMQQVSMIGCQDCIENFDERQNRLLHLIQTVTGKNPVLFNRKGERV